MFNKLLGDFINGAISAHTSRIKNQDVSLKFFQNSLNIAELELYKFALFQYGLPVIIKCGIIKNVEVIVPWASFQFDPVKITIDDIFILASFPGDNPTNFVSDQDIYDIREHQLAAHHEFAKKFNKILNQISAQKLSQIAQRVMHSCSIKIKNLHVRIEIPNPSQNNCHSFGFITSSINIFSPKPSKGIPPVIEKNIEFEGLSIYLDLNQDYLHYQNIDEFIQIMKTMSKIDENHQFLLDPSLIKAVMTTSTEKDESNIDVIIDLNNIVLSISKQQLPIISKMAVNAKKFCQFMFVKECKKFTNIFDVFNKRRDSKEEESNSQRINKNDNGNEPTKSVNENDQIKVDNENEQTKPDNENDQINVDNENGDDDFDASLCWVLFHNLAKRKKESLTDDFLDRILYRNKYIKDYNKLDKKSKRTKLIIELDHKLDYQAILFFQAVAYSIKEHGFNINYDKIYRFVEFDPLLLIPSFASKFTIYASAASIKVKFLNQMDKLDCSTILKGFSIGYGHKKMHIDLGSFNIIFESDKKQFDVLKPISNHKNLISIDASFRNFTSGSFSVSTEQMNLNVNLTQILLFISKLDLNLINDTINKIKIEKINYQLDIEVKETHLIPIYQDSVVFDLGFESFSVHQNKLNSNEYLASFNNLSFSHNNNYIFNELNIKSSRIKGILNISIPYFKVNLFEENFQKLDELKSFLQSASLLSQKAPLRLKNINVELDGIDVYSDLLKNTIVLKKSEISYIENSNKNELKSTISCIEIGYIVVKNLLFELQKETDLIQSVISVDQLYFKELQVIINSSIPFLKGTYNHAGETMDLNLGVESIEFKNHYDLLEIESFLMELLLLISVNKKENEEKNKTSNKVKEISFENIGKLDYPIENDNNNNNDDKENDNHNNDKENQNNNNNDDKEINNNDDENSNKDDNKIEIKTNNFKSFDEDGKSFVKYLLKLAGNKELKMPKINLTIHFISKPITIIYDQLNISISFEWSLLFNPVAFSLSIPSLLITYDQLKYLKIKDFAFIFSEKPEITVSANQIAINIGQPLIDGIKVQYNKIKGLIQKLPKNLFKKDKIKIPNVMINIQLISLKFYKMFKTHLIRIPISQFLAKINDKKDIDITSTISMKCSDLGLKTNPIDISLAIKTRRGNKSLDLNVQNPLKIDFHPLELNNFFSSENVFYVNQTGSDLTLIIDEKEFTIPDNSSYIASHFPINTKICFASHGLKAFLDVSRIYGEQSLPCFIKERLLLVWKTKSLLIFSSTIEILNKTGCSIKLLDDCFNKVILPNNQNMFIDSLLESKMKSISLAFLGTNLETDLEVKANLVKKSYTIKNDESYFRFIIQRNPRTLVSHIVITATIFIRSFFSEPLLIEFPVKNGFKLFALYPKIKVPINLFDINESKISFNLSSLDQNGFFKNCQYHVKISLQQGETTISLNDPHQLRQTLYLRCRVTDVNIHHNIIKIIDLSAPFFLINHLGFSTILSPIQDFKMLSMFQSDNQQQSEFLFNPLPKLPVVENKYSPYCISKEYEISFFLSHPPTMKFTKDKYVAMRLNSKELALLPTSKDDDKVMPVTFQVIHDESSTTTILLKPYVIIYNDTNKPINIDKKPLPEKNYLIVRSVSPTLDIMIDALGLRIPINLERISTFSVTGPSLQIKIQISVSFVDEIKYITISTINTLGLFAAINETEKDFIINQTGMEAKQYFVLPQSSLLFDLSDTRTECSIDCCAENIPVFSVHLDRTMEFVPIPGMNKDLPPLFYSVEIVGNNRYVVHFTDKMQDIEKVDNSRMNFLLNIPMISLKLIGKNFREYCRITFGSLSFHILHQETKESIALSIESVQVDDMNEFADHPVVLLSQKKPFFNLSSMRTIGSTFFEYVIIAITPIAAEIDISFVIDMISLFDFLNKEKEEVKNDKFLVKKDQRIHILLLEFPPVDFDISFFTNTPRQIHRFEPKASIPRFLSIIPTIDDFHIQLSPIKAADLKCSEEELLLILLDNAKSSFSSHWLRLIGSAAIIGNPQKLINNFSSAFKSPAKKIPKELLIGTAGTLDTILKSGETTLKGISSTFRSVSHDDSQYIKDNKTAIGGLSWGFKSFVSGVAKAATGIITKPIERAQETGFKGALKGAGEGIVGIVTNSVGGAVDLTAGILTGVRRGIFGEKAPKRVEEPVTKHRAYVTQMSQIGANDAAINSINKLVFIFVSDEADICEDVIFVGEEEIKIDEISWVEKLENSKIVKIEIKNDKKKRIEVEFKKEMTANDFQSILQLQIERKMTQKVLTVPY